MNKQIFICFLILTKLTHCSQEDSIATTWINDCLPTYKALIERAREESLNQSFESLEQQELMWDAWNKLADAINLYGPGSLAAQKARTEYNKAIGSMTNILIIHNPRRPTNDRSPTGSQPRTGNVSTDTVAAQIIIITTPTVQSPTTQQPYRDEL